MTVKEYIVAKNKLLKKYTGYTLVPEHLIRNLEPKRLTTTYDSSCCPYCIEYRRDSCEGCPLNIDDNKCHSSDRRTGAYDVITVEEYIITSERAVWYKELSDLVNEFNNSNNL